LTNEILSLKKDDISSTRFFLVFNFNRHFFWTLLSVVLADVRLNRVLRVERPVAVGAGDGLAVHVLAFDVPLKTVSILNLLVAYVAPPIARLQLLHLKIPPH
jgi:hypothetical protein